MWKRGKVGISWGWRSIRSLVILDAIMAIATALQSIRGWRQWGLWSSPSQESTLPLPTWIVICDIELCHVHTCSQVDLCIPLLTLCFSLFFPAVLVWLNYKNAYEYWTEQRMTLNNEVLTATRQVMDKLPQMAPTAASASFSTLFLQLTVDDMGICVPLNSSPFQVKYSDGTGDILPFEM